MSGTEVPATPDAAFLSAVLRDPSRWPVGFEWNYSHCATCAVGMAGEIWGFDSHSDWGQIAESFGFSIHLFNSIFDWLHQRPELGHYWREDVTPTDVADALDRAIAAQVSA